MAKIPKTAKMAKRAGLGAAISFQGAPLADLLNKAERSKIVLMDKKIVLTPGDYHANVISGHVMLDGTKAYPKILMDMDINGGGATVEAFTEALSREVRGLLHIEATEGKGDGIVDLGKALDELEAFMNEFIEKGREAIRRYPDIVADQVVDQL